MSQVVAGSVYPQSCRFSKTFLLQQFVQEPLPVQKIGPRGRALAEGRNALSTNHLTQAVGPIPGRCGPNPAMDKETRAR